MYHMLYMPYAICYICHVLYATYARHHMLYAPCTTVSTRATAETLIDTVQLKAMLTAC